MQVHSKPRLLVIDDDPDQRFIIGQLLEMGGFEVSLAESANEALKVLGREKVDLIVSDIMMPQIKGIDFANYLSTLQSNSSKKVVPIVLVTAGRDDIAEEVKESGASGFCFKSDVSRKLLPLVRGIVGHEE